MPSAKKKYKMARTMQIRAIMSSVSLKPTDAYSDAPKMGPITWPRLRKVL